MRSLPLLGAPPDATDPIRSPLLAKGFRPFFLLAAAFAALVVPLWVLALFGVIRVGGHLDPVTWHAHEMLFGFAGAVIAGFLLTAAGNWTGRETAVGGKLLALVLLWIAGRLAMTTGAGLPSWIASGIDLAFLPAVTLAIGVPIARAGSRRNYVVLAMLVAMSLANLALHAGAARTGLLVGVDVVALLMVVIAGRVVPMFTRNATRNDAVRSHPRLDAAAALSVAAVAVADASGSASATFLTCSIAAALVASRTVHWGARSAAREPLLWILHAGHAFIPVGLALRAASAVHPAIGASLGIHAITAGAIGALTLGMMARVALGHTGRPLVAPRPVAVAFGLVLAAALVRVGVPLVLPALTMTSLAVTAVLWALAFAIFAIAYAPILAAPRIDGKPG